MRGSYQIRVQNHAIRYDFTIKRNITIIKGKSATGKTTLIELIREFYENGSDSGIELFCEKTCSVLEGRDWNILLKAMKEYIIFIDEGNAFIHSIEFAKAIQQSNNYYVIVTREGLPSLPYSINEIYGIRESGKYANLKQIFNELYHIYGKTTLNEIISPSKLIIEDSNSGYQFFKALSKNKYWSVSSASGKSNIFAEILRNIKEEKILVIADGAAFGAEIDRIMRLVNEQKNIILYLPESFEWLVLKSEILADYEVKEILANPSEYIESKDYFSWERYFTALLIEKTENTYLQYTKKKINPSYLQKNIQHKICEQIQKINLSKIK